MFDKNVKTYVLKNVDDFVGYFELNLHPEKNEVEIAYLRFIGEYQNKKLGSYFFFYQKPLKIRLLINLKEFGYILVHWITKMLLKIILQEV